MLFATAELGRKKRRFGLLTLGAGLLVFVLLFMQSLLAAILDGMAGAVKQQTAPVIVFPDSAKRSLGGGMITPDQEQAIGAVPEVGEVGGLALGLMSFRAPGREGRVNVSVIGYHPGRPGSPTGIVEGREPAGPNEIVASAEGTPARYSLGETLTFEPGEVPLTVVGLTEGSLLNIGPALWIPWESFEKLTKLTTPDTTFVFPSVLAVTPAEGVDTAGLVDAVNTAQPSFDAVTREVAADSAPGRNAIQSSFLMVMLLCYLVVGIVIGFFFLTITLQKEQSITMLRAVGADAGYLIRCLLLEVAIVMGGGVVVGVVCLYLIRPSLRSLVILDIDPLGLVVTVVPALAVALLGTLPPIRRMTRTDPNALLSRPSLGNVA